MKNLFSGAFLFFADFLSELIPALPFGHVA